MTSPEAPLLNRMNELKQAASPELLTEAQADALAEIRDHREDDAKFINLHGPPDAGKTFLCWVLQQTEGWTYYSQMPDSADDPVVIYDHGDADRMGTRQLRTHASINGLATVVYVTQTPAEEVYPRVELNPADNHYNMIQSNWESLGLSPAHAPTS